MKPTIAIHCRAGSFSDRWVEYCDRNKIPYVPVDCYNSDVLRQLADVKVLMWHWSQERSKDLFMARYVIASAERMGIKVFPSMATCWHFDDKLAQKYLLESIGAPLVPTHAFYDYKTAMEWVSQTPFPKVFKLRRGAGSVNVKLVSSPGEARGLIKRAFSQGFSPVQGFTTDASTKFANARRNGRLLPVLKRLPRTLLGIYRARSMAIREKGYVYFQDFIPGNRFDTRITVVGNRAFGFTRNVRKNDFRASGSGSIDYDRKRINPACVRIAFDVARKIGAQSLAFDFVSNEENKPLIVEISYCYVSRAVYECSGHWDDELSWHEGHVWPEDAIIEDMMRACPVERGGEG